MEIKSKNVKISNEHHKLIKDFCQKNGQKIHRVIEKLIEEHCKPKKKDLYGES